jgi:signal transduction histidine kinase
MNVTIASGDAGLHQLCKDILTGYSGNKWKLNSDSSPADLYIWDINSAADIPTKWESGSRYLFLVHRRDSKKFQVALARPEAAILVKPVMRPTLAAFLGIALAAHADRVSSANLRADRDEIFQCLIQANLKLQEYDQNRTNFLSRAMHDFRVPLTAINGYCGLLLSEVMGPLEPSQVDVLRKMRQSSHRLSRMAEAMFQLSMGGQPVSGVAARKESIRGCVEQCIHEVAPTAEGKQISISVDLDPAAPELYFERTLIEQALVNFLDNACKFTPKGGQIALKGYPVFWERRTKANLPAPVTERRRQNSREPNGYRLDISNSGKAIPVEHLEDIFEEYASYSGGQDRSGGGLGLAICRMIVTQHEGRVWAENTDRGPQFSFILPARPKSMAISVAPRAMDGVENIKELTH